MRNTKEQKFLYSRIAILVASVGWLAFAFAGFKGFPFWYGGFVLCFWVAFGLVNYHQKTSLWLAFNRRNTFLLFWGACAGGAALFDQFGLVAQLWFYPLYKGWWFLWVYGILYPFGGFACLELFYFLAQSFGEHLKFIHRKNTPGHTGVDVVEGLLFLVMTGGALYGIARGGGTSVVLLISLAWVLFAAIKLALHIGHWKQYLLILVATFLVAAALHEMPNTGAFEWIYLEAPILNTFVFSVPLWVWLGYSWMTLFTLRFWVYLVLHPKVK